jgi:hypothetical protein
MTLLADPSDSFLGNFLVASFPGFPGNAEAWNILLPIEVKGLPGKYVDGIELIFRPPGQLPQLEACVFESRNASPPKRRSIGEFLEKIIFVFHCILPLSFSQFSQRRPDVSNDPLHFHEAASQKTH